MLKEDIPDIEEVHRLVLYPAKPDGLLVQENGIDFRGQDLVFQVIIIGNRYLLQIFIKETPVTFQRGALEHNEIFLECHRFFLLVSILLTGEAQRRDHRVRCSDLPASCQI